MNRRLVLNVVVGKRAFVIQLLSSENEPLLLRFDRLLGLNLGLQVLYRVRRLGLYRDVLSSESSDEDLHETEREWKARKTFTQHVLKKLDSHREKRASASFPLTIRNEQFGITLTQEISNKKGKHLNIAVSKYSRGSCFRLKCESDAIPNKDVNDS